MLPGSSPLVIYANKMLSVSDIDIYLTGTFMYQCIHEEAPEVFLNFFHANSYFHDHDTRHSEDLYDPYGMSDVRKFNTNNMEQRCGSPYQIEIKKLSLYTCLSKISQPFDRIISPLS